MVTVFKRALDQLRPRDQVRALDWFIDYVHTPDGRPYDHWAYPHIGAPGGPCDALDDENVTDIWLQWASRLGKTFFAQCALLRAADIDPCTMLLVSESQKTCLEITGRTYGMLERCPRLRGQLATEHWRKQDVISLAGCRIFCGWARSVGTLSDKGVKLGHANEIDKWQYESTSTEADPLKLFDDRFKEFARFKRIKESTPSVKTRSRVERGRLGGTNCSYWVPCPKCKGYQILRLGKRNERGGIAWDRTADGRSDAELAYRTSRYICRHCDEGIGDEDRPWMMRHGVWCPEGTSPITKQALRAAEERSVWEGWKRASWLRGKPLRDGRSASYHLSSLYALSLTWGHVGAEYLEVKDRPGQFQNFVNQWLAETFSHTKREQSWEQLGQKWISQVPRAIVPREHVLLTLGVDKQDWGYVWVLESWGPGRTSHTVAYGDCEELQELRSQVIDRKWRREDDADLPVSLTLIDSGFRPKGVGEFCRRMGYRVMPCKGSGTRLNGVFKFSRQSAKSAMPGLMLVMIDTEETQDWIESQIYDLQQPMAGAATLFRGSLEEHRAYLEQCINDAPMETLDNTNNLRERWGRVDVSIPNDYRDCRRYAYAAMWRVTRGGPIRAAAARNDSAPLRTGMRMPDGRNYLVTER